jgi:CRP-like cAMP-binding protein
MDLFRQTPPEDLLRIAERATFRRVDSRAMISPPGPRDDVLCLMIQGIAKATRLDVNGTETVLYLMKPGDLFGGHVWESGTDMGVVALQPCETAHIRIRDLEAVLGAQALATEIGRMRTMRLGQIENRLSEIGTGRVSARAARTVLRLCHEFPLRLACGTQVDVPFTQQDIASMIGASREVTSSTLNEFRRSGWLGIHNRYLCVHDEERLHEKALSRVA